MAGYSPRSLVDKLGIKEGFRVALVEPPEGYRTILGVLPEGTVEVLSSETDLNFVQCFARRRLDLEKLLPKLKSKIRFDGMLWISWPKGSSGVATDVNENVVREIALKNGLVDVKVCAVDETWSGLKLVYRTKDRVPAPGRKSKSEA